MRGSSGFVTGSGSCRRRSIRIRSTRTLAAAGAPLYAAHCQSCHADQPVPRRRHCARDARRPGRADCRHRHGSSSPRFVHRRVRRESVCVVSGLAVPVHSFQKDRADTRIIRWTASGCGDRSFTTARSRRFARCSMLRTRGRRCSTGAMTCSTRRTWDSSRMFRRPAARPSRGSTRSVPGNGNGGHVLRHDALRRGQGSAGRVHEDILRRAIPHETRTQQASAPLDCCRDRRASRWQPSSAALRT